jgi:hypothetical protein
VISLLILNRMNQVDVAYLLLKREVKPLAVLLEVCLDYERATGYECTKATFI